MLRQIYRNLSVPRSCLYAFGFFYYNMYLYKTLFINLGVLKNNIYIGETKVKLGAIVDYKIFRRFLRFVSAEQKKKKAKNRKLLVLVYKVTECCPTVVQFLRLQNRLSKKSIFIYALDFPYSKYEKASKLLAFKPYEMRVIEEANLIMTPNRPAFSNIVRNLSLPIRKQRFLQSLDPVKIEKFECDYKYEYNYEQLGRKFNQHVAIGKGNESKSNYPCQDQLYCLRAGYIDANLFQIFLENAGACFKRQPDLRRSQLQIIYTILYHCGISINKIRYLNQETLKDAIYSGDLTLLNDGTKKRAIYRLSNNVRKDLKKLESQNRDIFTKYKLKYLFGKEKPITDKNLIKMVNRDLENTCNEYNILFKITSNDFRFMLPNYAMSMKSEIKYKNIDLYTYSIDTLEKYYSYYYTGDFMPEYE
nr:hypothetical protein [Navicula tsukamotoi]